MKAEITLIELADKINAHLASGGVVIDTYGRDRESNIIGRAVYEDEEDTSYLHLFRAGTDYRGTTIPSSDILEAEGHEVAYTPNSHFGYLGKIAFLNPAPVDLPRADDAGRAARIAYAAAISDYDDALKAAEAAANAVDDAVEAAEAAAAAAYDAKVAYEAAADAVDDARDALVAAKDTD